MLVVTFLIIHNSIYCQKEPDNPAQTLYSDTISFQKQKILDQNKLLDSLDNAILLKEKLIEEKQKVIGYQNVQIRRQKSLISSQKKIISGQQVELQVQKDTLENQKARINDQMLRINNQLSLISEQDKKIILQVETIESRKLSSCQP